jgi:2-haloacid dehalogenase
MAVTLAFDVYGTLIDTSGVTKALEKHAGSRAPAFSALWRDKQLEYSFRRGLMQNYQSFAICTRNALDYTASYFKTEISIEEKEKLMAGYRVLPAFPDIEEGLKKLQSGGFRMFAFSNGQADDVRALLLNARIDNYFKDVISVDEIKSFKPNPAVYDHFLRRSKTDSSEAWLISGNPFDVIGAISSGMSGAWIRRSPDMVFDPWDIKPTVTVSSIAELLSAITGAKKQNNL